LRPGERSSQYVIDVASKLNGSYYSNNVGLVNVFRCGHQSRDLTGAATMLSVLGALVGVFGNLWWNRRQHRDERSLSLRRDIYLNAIDVINRASSFAASKASLKSNKEGEDKDTITLELSGVCAKLHILGTKRLVSAVIAFQTGFDEWQMKVNRHNRIVPEIDKIQQELFQHIEEIRSAANEFTAQSSEIVKLRKEFKFNPDDKEDSKKRGQEILKLSEEFLKRRTDLQVEMDRLKEEARRMLKKRLTHIGKSFSSSLQFRNTFLPSSMKSQSR
jgi:hypothetical protein